MSFAIPKDRLQALPSNYMMHAFGSDSEIPRKTVTFVATVAAAYFSFQYLPPGMDKLAGGVILLAGATLLFFCSFSKVLVFTTGFFSRPPGPPPRQIPSYPSSFSIPPVGLQNPPGYGNYGSSYGSATFGSYGSRPFSPSPTPTYHPPSHFGSFSPTVRLSDGEYGSLHTGSFASGERAKRKDSHYQDSSHLEHKSPPTRFGPPPVDLTQSWSPSSFPSSFSHGRREEPTLLHPTFKAAGTRAKMKDKDH